MELSYLPHLIGNTLAINHRNSYKSFNWITYFSSSALLKKCLKTSRSRMSWLLESGQWSVKIDPKIYKKNWLSKSDCWCFLCYLVLFCVSSFLCVFEEWSIECDASNMNIDWCNSITTNVYLRQRLEGAVGGENVLEAIGASHKWIGPSAQTVQLTTLYVDSLSLISAVNCQLLLSVYRLLLFYALFSLAYSFPVSKLRLHKLSLSH